MSDLGGFLHEILNCHLGDFPQVKARLHMMTGEGELRDSSVSGASVGVGSAESRATCGRESIRAPHHVIM